MPENTLTGQPIGAPVAATDVENDSLTYALGGTDASSFDIDASSGQLLVGASLDYEQRKSYAVTVSVSDGKDADGNADTAIDASTTVTVTVANVDEPGVLAISPQALRIGSVIGARLSDPDGEVDPTAVSWTWSTSSGTTTWDPVSTSSSSYAPVEADLGRYLRVRARYADGHGSDKEVQIASEGVVGTRDVVPNLAVRTLVSGLDIPWDVAFAPDGTMLFTERGGVLSSRLTDGTVQTVTADLSDLFVLDTSGLMAITVDPNFAANRRFYTCLTHTGPEVQVIAWTIDDAYTRATRVDDPLVGGIPASPDLGWNSGCRLRFGPDGYLWIATGDGHSGTVPQDVNSLGGKILRVSASTGAAAPGNPFGSRVYTYGHRNPQGLALRPGTSEMWTVEHGPDFDDEINVLTAGGNYGWDPVPGYNEAVPMTDFEKFPGAIEAKWSSGVPPVAPSGGIFIEGARWENWARALAVATLKGESLRIFHFTDDGTFASQVIVAALDGTYGRLRTPVQGPDGALYVTTSNGGSNDRILQVIPNEAPLFTDRASAQEVAEDADTSTIAATPSASDPDGDSLTYTLSGRGAGSFEIADPSVGGIRPRVALDHETNSFFDVLLTATDPYGASDTVVVLIVVTNVDEAPEVKGPANVAVGEGTGSRVVASYSARDPEGRATTWSLSGTDSEDFEISTGGVLSFAHAPDADTPADDNGDNVYLVTVEASDRVRVGTLDVTVTVADGNSAPAFASSSTARSIAENTPAPRNIGAPVAATDDDGDSLTYTLGGADAASFDIVADSGQLRTRSALDFETTPSYTVTVSVSDKKDADGNTDAVIDDTVTVTISVTDVNEPPAFPADADTRSVDENTAAGQDIGTPVAAADGDGDSLTYAVGGAGAAFFDIVASSGQLRTRSALDFEATSSYAVTVSVSDGANANGDTDGAVDDTVTVTISVHDLEEDGAITVPTDQPQVGTALTATLSDPDGGVTGVAWQWQVSDDQSAWSDITTATSASYTPVAGDENRYLRVRASYGDRRGSGKRAERSLPDRVQLAPAANSPPEFPSASTTRSVDENTSSGQPIGAPVAAVDGDALAYGLGGADAASFSIDQNTGQLRTNAALDYETRSSYRVVVTATDPSHASDTIAVRIDVVDRNEPPAFAASLRGLLTVDENTPAGRLIGESWTATDPEEDALTHSLGGADAASFDIVAKTGQLLTSASLDHEVRGSYRVDIHVTDGRGDDGTPDPVHDDTLVVAISVRDVNEPPVVSGETTVSYAEDRGDAVATYAHNDPDARATITWSLSGTDRDDFAIDGSGVLGFTDRPDREDPRDAGGDNEYHVTIVASDGILSDSLDVRVTVTGVNEGPDVSGPQDPGYAEHGTQPVATYADNDPEHDDMEWSLSGDDEGDFRISMDGVLDFREAPDHEHPRDADGNNEYHVTVTASDGALDDSLAVTITVSDVNEPPTLTGRSSIPVDEHGDGFVTSYHADDPDADAVLGWTLSGSDADHFSIDADAHLHFRDEADYEDPRDADSNNLYHLTVHVFDGAHTPSLDVTVAVQNVDEEGELALSSLQPQVGTPLAATLTDPDGSITSQSWQWQSSTGRSDWSDIVSATTRGYTPAASDEGRSLRVTASYADGEGGGKTARTELGAVRAAPASNNPPAFATSESGRRSIPENTDAGQPVGAPIAADDDPGDVLTYSLDRAGDAVFDIVAETGQLLTDAPLDREERSSHTVTVTATDSSGTRDTIRITVTVEEVNEPPSLSGDAVVSVPENSRGAVATYSATDPEGTPLTWRLEGRDAGAFRVDDGALSFRASPDFESLANVAGVNTYLVTIVVSDGAHSVTHDVTVFVIDLLESARAIAAPGSAGAGIGGGGPSGPTPSEADFEWTVTRDIEALDPGNDWPTGLWSDGVTVWVAENGPGADDEIYACDLQTGERREEAEFELHETNRAPRGFWSDGETAWVSDSGQDRLFAYDLATGARLEEHEFELAARNRYPRGIWSNGVTIWVLDGRDDALFGYDLASGELLGEYALDDDNGDPSGLWSDRASIWVSDHGAKRLFAYRLPVREGDAVDDENGADAQALERLRSEEFTELSKASNNSPRGLWSDGEVMYVADESDDKVYSYNMPDALDARLASLTLSGVDFGEFDPGQTEYEGTAGEGVTETTVTAEALQRRTSIVIDPPDADVEADGHQVALEGLTEITATVTSADGSREKVYRVSFPGVAWDPARDPWPHCLRGAVSEGFSLVVFEGGTFDELVACAESRDIVALYALHEGVYVTYILGAPDFANRKFRELFADGLPVMTPLVVDSNEPPSADPFGDDLDDAGQQPWSECLRGDIVEGLSLVVYQDGTVEELVACAESRHVTALYALHEGEFVPYILGAPDFVNQRFRDLFLEGVPAITALVAKSEGPLRVARIGTTRRETEDFGGKRGGAQINPAPSERERQTQPGAHFSYERSFIPMFVP